MDLFDKLRFATTNATTNLPPDASTSPQANHLTALTLYAGDFRPDTGVGLRYPDFEETSRVSITCYLTEEGTARCTHESGSYGMDDDYDEYVGVGYEDNVSANWEE